jgi:hypothetical protein
MVAMAYEAAWPAAGHPFTVEDLDRLPEDGRRYELLNGVLIVSPGRARSTGWLRPGWQRCCP